MTQSDVTTATADAMPPRLLPLQGGRNFRDIGGYRTRHGRSVRWNQLYRSGSMAALTPADCALLAGFGIRLVCDLRTTAEREHAPSSWQNAGAPRYWDRDYAMSFGELHELAEVSPLTATQLHATMVSTYRKLPYEQAPAYREMFGQLAAGQLPMVVNCTAGKDRTGIAIALVLTALEVPRDIIIEDYALSGALLVEQRAFEPGSGLLGRLSADAVRVLMASDPEYLAAAFTAIEQRHGSVDDYLRDALDVGPHSLTAIRAGLLE